MISDLNTFLFSESQLPTGKIFSIGSSGIDNGFVISHFISSFLKGNGNVILVSFCQSVNHYNCIAVKLGLDLKLLQNEGRFSFVDGLAMLHTSFIEKELPTPTANGDGLVWSRDRCSLAQAHKKVQGCLKQNKDAPTVVIIDDVFSLLAVGVPRADILNLMRYQCDAVSADAERGVCLVIGSSYSRSNCSADGNMLFNSMCHMSDVVIAVTGLQTGYSRDVNGEITLTTLDSKDDNRLRKTKKAMQFKLSDKLIKLFPRGTSAAVL